MQSLIFMFASCTFDFSCAVSGLCQDMLVFTVMTSKVKLKAVQIKSKIWEMKGGKYAKTLPKIQLKLMELCMETPCWCPSYPATHPGEGTSLKEANWDVSLDVLSFSRLN